MRHALTIVVTMLLGASVFASEPPHASKPTVTNLMLTTLDKEFTPDRQVLVDLVEIPPNTTLDRHWHPGEEFHYYLEGEVEIRIEGGPSIIGRPGGVGHVPFRKRHQAIAGEKGAKILVVRVHKKGEPWRYVDDEAPAAQ